MCISKAPINSILSLFYTFQLQLNPNQAKAHVTLADLHLELRELEDAERHFREAVRLDTSDFLSLFKIVKVILDHLTAQTRERLLKGVEMYEI